MFRVPKPVTTTILCIIAYAHATAVFSWTGSRRQHSVKSTIPALYRLMQWIARFRRGTHKRYQCGCFRRNQHLPQPRDSGHLTWLLLLTSAVPVWVAPPAQLNHACLLRAEERPADPGGVRPL